jgi:hypothetical protein
MAGTPSRTLVLTLTAVTDKFKKGIGAAEGDLSSFGDKLGSFAKKGALALAALGAAAGALAVKIGKEAISAASDLSEEIAKSGELFGESAGKIEEWSKTAATAFGQSRRQATQAAGTFAIFGRSAGLTGDELVDFSTGFTELASDLASFNNTSPEDAINAIGSALRGEALPLRRYGILLDDATMRQKAFELGIISSTKEALTPQQKILAAQQLIYEQAGAAAGDFARTSDGLANSQRILAANLEDVKATLGESLLPIAEEFTGWLVSVLPNVIELAREMGEKLAPKIGQVGDFIKERLLPFARDVWPHIRDFALWVKELVVAFKDFVVDDVAPRFLELIQNLREPAAAAWAEIKELKKAVDEMTGSFKAANPEGSKFLDWTFKLSEISFEFFIEQIRTITGILDSLAGVIKRLNDLRSGQAFGGNMGGVDLPADFVPGIVQPAPINPAIINNNNITINGPTNSEQVARDVRRILGDSDRRTGFQPIGAR